MINNEPNPRALMTNESNLLLVGDEINVNVCWYSGDRKPGFLAVGLAKGPSFGQLVVS